MIKNLFYLLIAFPIFANAGGDFTPSKISQFSGSDGHYQFTVTQVNHLLYQDDCRTYRVMIQPPVQTWREKWIPYIKISGSLNPNHPTLAETHQTAEKLKQIAQQQQIIQFGYIGGGLMSDKQQKCLYRGTGMKMDGQYVFVYHDGRRALYPYAK